MKRKFSIFAICVFVLYLLTSCFTTENVVSSNENTTSTKTKNEREIILDGESYTTNSTGPFSSLSETTSWRCMDWYKSSGDKVLFEIGYFTKMPTWGFILYDGTNEGTGDVYHCREGLDHRWDWGAGEDGSFQYSFVIKPDGTGQYYHFLEGEQAAKPNSLYRTKKRE